MKTVNPVRVLQDYVDGYVTQRDAAAHLKIGSAYLSDMLHGRRDISDRILAKLKLKRVVVADTTKG